MLEFKGDIAPSPPPPLQDTRVLYRLLSWEDIKTTQQVTLRSLRSHGTCITTLLDYHLQRSQAIPVLQDF